MSIPREIAKLITLITFDPSGESVPITSKTRTGILTFLVDNFGLNCANYIMSCLDYDEDDKCWYAHMNPGEALLDWMAKK